MVYLDLSMHHDFNEHRYLAREHNKNKRRKTGIKIDKINRKKIKERDNIGTYQKRVYNQRGTLPATTLRIR